MSIDNAVVLGTPRCTEDDVIKTSFLTAPTTTDAGGVEGGSQGDIIPTADTLSLPSSEVSKGTDDDSTSKEEETNEFFALISSTDTTDSQSMADTTDEVYGECSVPGGGVSSNASSYIGDFQALLVWRKSNNSTETFSTYTSNALGDVDEGGGTGAWCTVLHKKTFVLGCDVVYYLSLSLAFTSRAHTHTNTNTHVTSAHTHTPTHIYIRTKNANQQPN